MKRKYIKGFLCRDADIRLPNNIYWFFEDKPQWNAVLGLWFEAKSGSLLFTWKIEKFKEEYDCNFQLPRKGEKVECWVEVGDE